MAAVPVAVAEADRRSSSSSRQAMRGRGGAGNMGPDTADVDPVDLETPTIKSDVYTTGRGGNGNMAKNTDPEEARKAQDVVAHPRRESDATTHVGRGGAANVFRPSLEEGAAGTQDYERWEGVLRNEAPRPKLDKGLAERGKQWLFGKMR